MAKKDNLKFHIDISPELYEWADPEKLKEARKNAVTAAGMVWANKSGDGKKIASESDVIYELEEDNDQSILHIGSAVKYAESLEKRYGLMARGLDRAKPRMEQVSDYQVKKTLGIL